jgi:hypothetical protein
MSGVSGQDRSKVGCTCRVGSGKDRVICKYTMTRQYTSITREKRLGWNLRCNCRFYGRVEYDRSRRELGVKTWRPVLTVGSHHPTPNFPP